MLITFDNEVWLSRYYPLILGNIFKLSFINVVIVNFIRVASIFGPSEHCESFVLHIEFWSTRTDFGGQLDNNQRKPPEIA